MGMKKTIMVRNCRYDDVIYLYMEKNSVECVKVAIVDDANQSVGQQVEQIVNCLFTSCVFLVWERVRFVIAEEVSFFYLISLNKFRDIKYMQFYSINDD